MGFCYECKRKCILENPLVLVIDLLGILTVIYMLCGSLVAGNFGSWSLTQNIGYYSCLFSSGFFVCNITWLMYFFHKYPRTHYRQPRLAAVNLSLGICYLLSVGTFYCLTYEPTKTEMREHLRQRYFTDGAPPDVYNQLQKELKCCGVENYTDYIPDRQYLKSNPTFKEVPASCCLAIRRSPHCGVNELINSIPEENLSTLIYTKGCVKDHYSEIKNTTVYRWFYGAILSAFIPPFFPILTIILIQIILCATKPKSELPYLPSMRNSWETLPGSLISVFKVPAGVRSSTADPEGIFSETETKSSI